MKPVSSRPVVMRAREGNYLANSVLKNMSTRS